MKTLIFLTLIFFTVALNPLCAQMPDLSAWEKQLAGEMARTHVPGAAIGMVRDGKLVYARGFGVANAETGEAARPDQLFRLGSTTKMMTAAALVSLSRQNRLDLHAPIRQYVKGLPPALGALTTHQLLTHSAGLKDAASMAGSHDDGALGQYIRGWNDTWLFAKPGAVLSYSNPGYHLAGFVLESVTGKPFADAMEELVFRPLGMKRTTLRPLTAMTYPLAQGHNFNAASGQSTVIRPAADDASQWPAGSVFTSIDEWSRLVIALLDHGRLDHGRLDGGQALPAGTVEAMTRGYVPSAEEPDSSYGYGVVVSRERGTLRWQHGGSRAGYGSLLVLAPERRTAVFAVCNRSGASLGESLEKLLELVLQLPPQQKRELPVAAAFDPAKARALAGSFRNGDSTATVVLAGEALKLTLDGREFPAELRGGNKLVLTKGPVVTVVYGVDGRAEFLCTGLRCSARVPD